MARIVDLIPNENGIRSRVGEVRAPENRASSTPASPTVQPRGGHRVKAPPVLAKEYNASFFTLFQHLNMETIDRDAPTAKVATMLASRFEKSFKDPHMPKQLSWKQRFSRFLAYDGLAQL